MSKKESEMKVDLDSFGWVINHLIYKTRGRFFV